MSFSSRTATRYSKASQPRNPPSWAGSRLHHASRRKGAFSSTFQATMKCNQIGVPDHRKLYRKWTFETVEGLLHCISILRPCAAAYLSNFSLATKTAVLSRETFWDDKRSWTWVLRLGQMLARLTGWCLFWVNKHIYEKRLSTSCNAWCSVIRNEKVHQRLIIAYLHTYFPRRHIFSYLHSLNENIQFLYFHQQVLNGNLNRA